MNKTTCSGCGKTIVGRRYPLEPLADFMGLSISAACLHLGISGSTQKTARCHGITRNIADKAARALKEHPSAIWPEVVSHDIEDKSVPCEECGEPFIPVRKGHRFCSQRCSGRPANRRYQKKKWDTDPEWREAKRADRARRRTGAGKRVDLLKQRNRHARRVAEDPEFYKRRYERERERRLEYQRRWRAANKERVAEYNREYAKKRRKKEAA